MTVGRPAELEALASFLDDVAAEPSVLLIEGDPGVGRSTLWAEGVELARARGHSVLSCRPTGSDTALSFVGLGDLLRHVPEAALAALPAPQREALETSLLRRPRGARRPDHRAVAVATLGVLAGLAGGAPLVLAIDDVQWLDTATSRALAFALRRLGGRPVRWLLVRTADDGPPPLGVADALPPDRVRRMFVEPMGADELAALVRRRTGLDLPLPEARHLAEISGGNPFFALEIARAMARGDPGVTGQSLPIPRSLRDDVLAMHLRSFSPASADLLLVTSAAARPTLELLAAAHPGEGLPELLQEGIDAGVVQVAGAEVRFTHPLYRSAIYAGASRARRHAVHRRLAELTAEPEERARHLALSADAPDDHVASELEAAAEIARDRGAPDAAAGLLEHAIRLTPAAEGDGARRRHLRAADDRFLAGDAESASGHVRRALELSRSGVDRAEALRRIAAIDLERGAIADARRSLEAASADAGADTRVSARVRRELAHLTLRSGELAEAEGYARSATADAERSGDPALVLAARTTLARIEVLCGRAAAVLAAPPPPDPSPSGADRPELVLAEAEMLTGDHDAARRRLERLLVATSDRGDEPGHRAALVRLGEVELRDGSWDRAESLIQEGRTLGRQLGSGDAPEIGLLAYVAAVRGDERRARELAEFGLRTAGDDRTALLWNLGALGALELSLGRPEVALRHLGRAGGIATAMGLGEPAAIPFLPDEAEALVGVGEHDAADRRISWLEERGSALDRASTLSGAARCRGLLLAELGDLGGALAALEDAVDRLEPLPLPFERARALLGLGVTRRRDRQKRPAREALERALELFEALGARIWAERARTELARVSGRRASLTELTEAEERVVRLAASGLTNREIARALFMSVRTVEGHLSHAYAKLGLRSRTELAVFFQPPD